MYQVYVKSSLSGSEALTEKDLVLPFSTTTVFSADKSVLSISGGSPGATTEYSFLSASRLIFSSVSIALILNESPMSSLGTVFVTEIVPPCACYLSRHRVSTMVRKIKLYFGGLTFGNFIPYNNIKGICLSSVQFLINRRVCLIIIYISGLGAASASLTGEIATGVATLPIIKRRR